MFSLIVYSSCLIRKQQGTRRYELRSFVNSKAPRDLAFCLFFIGYSFSGFIFVSLGTSFILVSHAFALFCNKRLVVIKTILKLLLRQFDLNVRFHRMLYSRVVVK
uniref:Transmembrane protein n=1 Tax=Musca domestica TaxID=7370 RepID=A0A1I8MAQ0_MUSDO